MAIAVVNKAQSGAGASSTLTITSATTGNLLIAFFGKTASTAEPKIKDNVGGTWAISATKDVSATSANSGWFATKTAEGGETLLTVTPEGGTSQGISCIELSGATLEGMTIANKDNEASGVNHTSAAVSASTGDFIAVAVNDGAGAFTEGAWEGGLTTIAAGNRVMTGYLTATETLTGVTYKAKWTGAKTSGSLIVRIKPASTEQVGKGTGTLSLGDDLLSGGFKIGQGVGGEQTGPRITASGFKTGSATGGLSVGVRLTGTGAAVGSEQKGKGVGSLSVGPRVSATSAGVHAAAGSLSTGPRVQATGFKAGRSAAALSTGPRISATSGGVRKSAGALRVGTRLTAFGHAIGTGATGLLHVGTRIEGVGRRIVPDFPTSLPERGHVAVGNGARMARNTGRLSTSNAGRAYRS